MIRLVLLSHASEQPSTYLVVDGAARIAGRGTLSVDTQAAAFKGRTALIVPGADVVTRWLDLEDGPPARVAESAALLLKDHIGAPRDSIHLAVGEPEDDGARPVSVIDRSLMQDFIDRAVELGVSPDVVVPDHLMLCPPADGVLAVMLGSIVAVRGDRLAFSAEEELAWLLIGVRRRTTMEDISEIEQCFATGSARIPMNLLQQDFSSAGEGRAGGGYRRVAVLAAVAALSPLAIWAAEIARNEASMRSLEARAEARARTIVGTVGSADPILELRGRLAGLRANDGLMQTTAVLFDAVSRAQKVELESLSYLQEGVVRATLIHTASSDVNAVRDVLEQSGITVDEDAAEQRDGRMITTITLNRIS